MRTGHRARAGARARIETPRAVWYPRVPGGRHALHSPPNCVLGCHPCTRQLKNKVPVEAKPMGSEKGGGSAGASPSRPLPLCHALDRAATDGGGKHSAVSNRSPSSCVWVSRWKPKGYGNPAVHPVGESIGSFPNGVSRGTPKSSELIRLRWSCAATSPSSPRLPPTARLRCDKSA